MDRQAAGDVMSTHPEGIRKRGEAASGVTCIDTFPPAARPGQQPADDAGQTAADRKLA